MKKILYIFIRLMIIPAIVLAVIFIKITQKSTESVYEIIKNKIFDDKFELEKDLISCGALLLLLLSFLLGILISISLD